MQKVPQMLVIGDREVASKSVAVRKIHDKKIETKKLKTFLEELNG
jgi:threonyl-tRNA synthetase